MADAVSSEVRCCDRCGKPTFFNHSMWSSGPDGGTHTHGYGDKACEQAVAALQRMPLALDAAISALIDAQEAAGALIFQGDDDEYANVEMLQHAIHAAYAKAADGIDKISAALAGRSIDA